MGVEEIVIKQEDQYDSRSSQQDGEETENEQEDDIYVGKVYFSLSTGDRYIPFMLAEQSSTGREVMLQMKKWWKLDNPRIGIIIVSDPSARFAWKDRAAVDSLIKGLVKSFNTTDIWVFTDGLNVGISMEIGEGYRSEIMKRMVLTQSSSYVHKQFHPEVALIGVCSSESITYGKHLTKMNRPILLANGRYIHETGKYDLNPNHSHFIVIKDASQRGVHEFLSRVAEQMTQFEEHRSIISMGAPGHYTYRFTDVPVIALVVQGNDTAIDFVLNHLKQGLPVAVIKNSGGLADIIAYMYSEIQWMPDGSNLAEYAEKVLKPLVCQRAAEVFPNLRKTRLSQYYFYEKLLQCVTRFACQNGSTYLTVLDNNQLECKLEDLPSHFLRVLFKLRKPEKVKHFSLIKRDLILAMDWNSPDVAMEEIFLKEPSEDFHKNKELFSRALLKPNREGFLELFMKQGYNLRQFVNSFQLVQLFRRSMNEDFFRNVVCEEVLDFSADKEITAQFIDTKVASFVFGASGVPNFVNTSELNINLIDETDAHQRQTAEQMALNALVIWAVLSYRMKVVMVLWKHSDQPMHLAILISALLKKLKARVRELSLHNEMKKKRREYSLLAKYVLDACFEENPTKAFSLVQDRNQIWGWKSLMEIAGFAQDNTLLAHPCFQLWLDFKFMGNIRLEKGQGFVRTPDWIKVILSAFFVFPMYYWVKFYQVKGSKMPESRDEQAHREGDSVMILDDESSSDSESKAETFIFDHETSDDEEDQNYEAVRMERIKPVIWKKIYYMWSAPITKFYTFHFLYCIYLVLLSLATIWPTCGNKTVDFFTCVWTGFFLVSYIYNAHCIRRSNPTLPMTGKLLEIAFMALFLIFYVTTRLMDHPWVLTPYGTKVLLCLALIYFYYRMIFMCLPISPELGPLLLRVKRMILVDFANFMQMALLFMVSNGIVMQAILYPDYPIKWTLLFRVIQKVWVFLFKVPDTEFGHLDLKCVRYVDRPFDPDLCRAGKYLDSACATTGIWPYIFVVQYLMLLKLCLFAFLYALFSATQAELQEVSDFIWKCQRFNLIMDFSQRLLPPPLNIISFAYIFMNFFRRLFQKFFTRKKFDEKQDSKPELLDSHKEEKPPSFTRLTYECYKKVEQTTDHEYTVSKEMEDVSFLRESIFRQRGMINELQSRISELQVELSYTHKHLDDLKYRQPHDVRKRSKATQVLSRRSPYPYTKIQRFPVPDDRVSWEVQWPMYDPLTFTLPKEMFVQRLQPFVDGDLHLWLETRADTEMKPIFKWHEVGESAGGIFVDRQSWITDEDGNSLKYEIDPEGLPRNPMGRTGIAGKGSLPKWGPNHFIYVLVTRRHKDDMGSETDYTEFLVATSSTTMGHRLTVLPGGCVTSRNKFDAIQEFFKTSSGQCLNRRWASPTDMSNFFKSCLEVGLNADIAEDALSYDERGEEQTLELSTDEFQCERVFKGYMDDHVNTDQAWTETELWHFHYKMDSNLDPFLQENVHWQVISISALNGMCDGVVALLEPVLENMNVCLYNE